MKRRRELIHTLLTNEISLLDVLVGDSEPLVEVKEDGVGGDLSEAEVPVAGAGRVAAVERAQDALLHEEGEHFFLRRTTVGT